MRVLGYKICLSLIWQLGLVLIANSSVSAKDWEIIEKDGIEYVTAANVAEFYKIEHIEKKGEDLVFRHPSLKMEWKLGTKTILINKVKFNLSLNITESDGDVLITTVDLAKLIDPVVRPSFIKKSIEFDTVVIDPGHGGREAGVKGPMGLEKYYNLDLSLRLKQALKKRGFLVVMTREDDQFVELKERVVIANKQARAIFISIHHDTIGGKNAAGVETYALSPQGTQSTAKGDKEAVNLLDGNIRDAENIALATAVHAHVIHDLSPIDQGIKRARFKILGGINKPAILFNGGVLTNPDEAARIHDPAYRQRTAESIANAVVKFERVVGRK